MSTGEDRKARAREELRAFLEAWRPRREALIREGEEARRQFDEAHAELVRRVRGR
jgi:hypothetical protein